VTYRLNRDDYNYNGEPQVQFLMKGRKVRAVELNTGVYNLASTFVYSNNPVLVLIDYLTNVEFGRGLPVAKMDLESFYNAAAACDTVVSSGRSIGGLVNGGDGTRDLPLYECNITLDTESTIRENIERILETMGFAEMMWSPEGKYKLTLDYPTTLAETNALIPSTHVFTDDNILRDDVSLSWLPASERSNQATVNFMNEHEDFKEDSMTWPSLSSTAEGPELVTNGTFDTDTSGWTPIRGATLASVSGQLVVTKSLAAGGFATGVYAIPTIIGKTYDVSVDLIAKSVAAYAIISEIATHYSPQVGDRIVDNSPSGATYTGSFVAVGTISYLHLLSHTSLNATSTWDNISVKEADVANTSMTYEFDNDIDLGSVEDIRFVPNLTAVISDGITIVADYDPVSAITRFGGPIIDAAINFEVRSTSDDPAGTPTWSDWETFSVGNYRARGFEFRLTGVVTTAAYTIAISGLSITADKADVYKRGTSTSSTGADTTVTFATGFYGGIGGTDLPYVGCNTVGGSSSDIVNITSITKDTFVYSVYNSGTRVARAIAWQAVGQ